MTNKNYNIEEITKRIVEIMENPDDHGLYDIDSVIKKEMGDYYYTSKIPVSIESIVYLIYHVASLRTDAKSILEDTDIVNTYKYD